MALYSQQYSKGRDASQGYTTLISTPRPFMLAAIQIQNHKYKHPISELGMRFFVLVVLSLFALSKNTLSASHMVLYLEPLPAYLA